MILSGSLPDGFSSLAAATCIAAPSEVSATRPDNGKISPVAVAASTTNSPPTVQRAAGVQLASQSCGVEAGKGCGCFRRKVAAHLPATSETMIPPQSNPAPERVKACCRKYSSRARRSSLRISSCNDSLSGCCLSAALSTSIAAV